MEKQNLRGLALAREFATKYNRRRGVVPQEVEDALRHKFGHALDEYRARFACYYGMMTPVQYATAQSLGRNAHTNRGAGAGGSAGAGQNNREDRTMTAQSRTWAADDFRRAKKQTSYARKSRRMARRC